MGHRISEKKEMKNTRHSAGVYILVGVGGFPRTALSRRLWGIPNDLTARCLSNLLIVEPVVLISPLYHKIKMPHSGHFDFGGSGWIPSHGVITPAVGHS